MNYSPGQIVLLFTGAALVSIVLICLLNAEANNRRINREPEIVNGNLFSALGHQVKRLARSWALDDMSSNQSQTSNEQQVEGDTSIYQSQTSNEQQMDDDQSFYRRASGEQEGSDSVSFYRTESRDDQRIGDIPFYKRRGQDGKQKHGDVSFYQPHDRRQEQDDASFYQLRARDKQQRMDGVSFYQSKHADEQQIQNDITFYQPLARDKHEVILDDSYFRPASLSVLRRHLTSLDSAGSSQPQHAVRHAKHKNKTVTTTTTTTTTSTTTAPTSKRKEEVEEATSLDTTFPDSEVKHALNETSLPGGVKRRRGDHEQCFTTHEVLWIITITCGVNFTFVFLVLTCVRILGSSPHKITDFTGLESAYDTEVDLHKSTTRLCASDSYNSVQEYVDSLPDTSLRRSNNLATAYSMEDLLFV